MKIVILSAGSIAGSVARVLASVGCCDKLLVADWDLDKATRLAAEVGGEAARFDASDTASINSVITGADVVFNAVGPYFRFGTRIIRAAIECGVNYVDVCDEFDVAEQLVPASDLDRDARAAGVSVVFGMGFAPGITSLLGRWAAESLTTAHSVDVVMAVPYVVNLGATINEHMLHSMSGDVRQYLDGGVRSVPAWGEPRAYRFGPPFDTVVSAGYMGHPEAVTLGTHLPDVRNATVRYAWFEHDANELWQQFEKIGLTGPDTVDGTGVSPRRFLAHFMATQEGQQALAVRRDGQPGTAIQVIADGEIDGEPSRAAFEAHVLYANGHGQDPTPHAAAAAVRDMVDGRITQTGVMPPEACIDPEPFVTRVLGESGVTLAKRTTSTTTIR